MAGTFTAWRSRGAAWRLRATSWRFGIGGRRRPRTVARPARNAAPATELSGRQVRRAARREAWRDGDLMLDVTIVASVAVFLVLATGIGILALQSALH